jgi:NADH/NAD ratio-sensing transcriptional regulator Rex
MGILQHHDAVSGTENQKVAENYISTALKSIQKFLPLHLQIIK